MDRPQSPLIQFDHPESTSSNNTGSIRFNANGIRGWAGGVQGLKKRGDGIRGRPGGIEGLKKRGHVNRSWIKIDTMGESKILELDKATIMRHCSLPARDIRLLDPLFIYPSSILGREKAIVVSLEQIRCIITAEEVILMNSLDRCVLQYNSELCKRLQANKDHSGEETNSSSYLMAFTTLAYHTFLKHINDNFFSFLLPLLQNMLSNSKRGFLQNLVTTRFSWKKLFRYVN